MASEFDISDIPVADQRPQRQGPTSVLEPGFSSRPRAPFGLQEAGGLAGALGGAAAGGLVGGPVGAVLGGVAGAGLGGAAGEAGEQVVKGEPFSASRIAAAGLEEAAWDAGGNLVLKALGKTIRIGADKLGFTEKSIPDANKAAQEFLKQYNSSLTMGQRTDSGMFQSLEGVTQTFLTADLFKRKQKEIQDALAAGRKDILASLSKSPEFEQAIRSGSSSQSASGQVLQNFIREGEQSLSKAVDPEYKAIFADKDSRVSMFGIRQWAKKELSDPAKLTAGQRSILKEMDTLPPQVDVNLLHQMRSRWLAEGRDKYSALGTEKDSKAASTISDIIKKFDEAMDFSASKTLNPETLKRYQAVTRTYREGIQALQTDAVREALAKNPEEVGGFLFSAGKETPIKELYRSIAAAGTLSGKSSKEIIDAMRYGYLEALTNTPENMLKFANTLKQDTAAANTFKVLFGDATQRQAIEAMNKAAEIGLVSPTARAGLQLQTLGTLKQAGTLGTVVGTGYVFALTPEQQEKIKENLGPAALSLGGLVLSQRQLSKALLDPKGAKALTFLSSAKDKLTSPSAFTKLVVEPLYNLLFKEEDRQPISGIPSPSEFDISTLSIRK